MNNVPFQNRAALRVFSTHSWLHPGGSTYFQEEFDIFREFVHEKGCFVTHPPKSLSRPSDSYERLSGHKPEVVGQECPT